MTYITSPYLSVLRPRFLLPTRLIVLRCYAGAAGAVAGSGGFNPMISSALQKVLQKFNHHNLPPPLQALNKLQIDHVDDFHRAFVTDLENRLSNPDKAIKPSLADYINPRMNNIASILRLVEENTVPSNVLTHYNIQSPAQMTELVLSKLLYKKYFEYSIENDKKPPSIYNPHKPPKGSIDLTNPAGWFPAARKMKRKLVMHVGPTNSGKTHHSLEKLKLVKSGYYAGPLRLLAREIYERFTAQGISCNLVTGEEVVPAIDQHGKICQLSSGTIEMIPLDSQMEMCVIDEIQMIADEFRGEAWSNAVLGVQAKEVHMCGEPLAVPLIKKLAKTTGDELEIIRYERLGKLTVDMRPVKQFRFLRPGDCVIAFSKRKILDLKCKIEHATGLKVGVIYGALPPEIRSKQAADFNSGKLDVLVASDAVGMGLNLKIKRVVFSEVTKFDGNGVNDLSVSAVKQIAGRAGRYSKVAGESEGFVTAFKNADLKFVQSAMRKEAPTLTKACIWPPSSVWMDHMVRFPSGTSLYQVLDLFDVEVSGHNYDHYFVAATAPKIEILKQFYTTGIHKNMPIHTQLQLSLAPVAMAVTQSVVDVYTQFFKAIAGCDTRTVFDFNFLHLDILKQDFKRQSPDDVVGILLSLEQDHKLVILFLWLSQRFPTIFVDIESAMDIKTLIEKRISEELNNMKQSSGKRSFNRFRKSKRQ